MSTQTPGCPAKDHDAVMADVHDFVQDARQILKDNLLAAYLFGSFARGQETPESDIDILLIVKNYDYKLQYEISGLASDYSLEKDEFISAILDGAETWEKERYYNTFFYQELQRDGIRLC